MSKILVTGGSGLVGRYLKQIMPDAYYISSDDYDLTKENEVELLFKKNRFKTVIHLAARVGGIHHNIIEPVKYFEENILMNTLILKYSYKNKVKYFLTLLSSCIYLIRLKSFLLKKKIYLRVHLMKVYSHIHMQKEVWLFKLMPIIKNLKQIIII